MEDDNSSIGVSATFSFLSHDEVQSHFANLNIELLRGRHIQQNDYYLFNLLNNYEDELRNYYISLYGLILTKDKVDNELYYYLDFPPDGKGKLSDSSRHRDLTESQLIIGLMLFNMYYDRFFEYPKEICWEDIRKEVMEGEDSNLYKRLLFNDIREDYSDQEWNKVKTWLKRSIREFETLGWIEIHQTGEIEEIRFNLKASINRLAKLYKQELDDFDRFIEEFKLWKQYDAS